MLQQNQEGKVQGSCTKCAQANFPNGCVLKRAAPCDIYLLNPADHEQFLAGILIHPGVESLPVTSPHQARKSENVIFFLLLAKKSGIQPVTKNKTSPWDTLCK